MMMSLQRARFAERYGKTPEETSACAAYVKKWWPEEAAHRIRIADEVMGQTFLFDLPWDMEQTAEPVTFPEEIDWTYQPGDDPEFIYQMNRHRYWVCMGQAYAMSGAEHYARAFASQLSHWIFKNPITEELKPKTWRTIEAGLRAESWIKAMGYFVSSPSVSNKVFGQFLDSMACHGAYLAACDVPFSTKSNWGVLENSGLYAIGKMLACVGGYPEGERYAQIAKKRLTRQIGVQVMDDGVHWEQSPMYHNEVLKCYLEALRSARLCGDTFPSPVEEKVKAMAYADRIWQKPDGSQPPCGDSDVTDLRDVLTVCGYWFSDPVLKFGGFEHMEYEGAWDYGMDAAADYEALASRDPETTCAWLKDSGNWYLRSSWGTDADYLHVRCGSLGGGHGHFDKCHMDLVVGGEDILIDPGRYTYVDGRERRAFKSAKAHNSVTVDGAEYTRCLDSWGVDGLLPALPGNLCRKGEYTLIECSHLGYMDRGVFVERRILAIGTGIYLVMDTCYGGSSENVHGAARDSAFGEHSFQQHFHLAPGLTPVREKRGFSVRGKSSLVTFRCVSDGASMEEEEFGISQHYNQKEPGRMVTFSGKGSGTFSLITVVVCQQVGSRKKECGAEPVDGIMPESGSVSEIETAEAVKVPVVAPVSGRTLEDREAEAVKVTCGGRAWLVVNAHVEAGADCEYIGAEGCYGLGRVMAAEIKEPGQAEKEPQETGPQETEQAGERQTQMVVLRW